MAATDGERQGLLDMLEKTFSKEGRTGTGPGSDDTQELPAEIKEAIGKLEAMREKLHKDIVELEALKSQTELAAPGVENVESSSTANVSGTKDPSVQLQLAIIDSLLIMFEIPANSGDRAKRVNQMNAQFETIWPKDPDEKEMIAGIDFMEKLVEDEVFSRAVYHYMRVHFCKITIAEIDALDKEYQDANIPFKDYSTIQIYAKEPVVCTGIKCRACYQIITTPDKCVECDQPMHRECMWEQFFKNYLEKRGGINKDNSARNDPNIPFLIKLTAYLRVRDSDSVHDDMKARIQSLLQSEMDEVLPDKLFQCQLCRATVYLYGPGNIQSLMDSFRQRHAYVLDFMDKKEVISGKSTKLPLVRGVIDQCLQIFNGEVQKLILLYAAFKTEYETKNYSYSCVRDYYNKITREGILGKLRDILKNFNAVIYRGLELGDDLGPEFTVFTNINKFTPIIWRDDIPFLDEYDPNLIPFLSNPVSTWVSEDGSKTFSEVLDENVQEYLLNPEGFKFPELKEVVLVPPVGFDLGPLAVSVANLIKKEVSDGSNGSSVDQFRKLANNVREFLKSKDQVLRYANRKLRRALAYDYMANYNALSLWAANYNRLIFVSNTDTQISLAELFQLPGIVAVFNLLAFRTDVELYAYVDLEGNEIRNISNLDNRIILPPYKHLQDPQRVAVPGPRKSSEAMTEYVLKKVLVGKCEGLNPDPSELFRLLESVYSDISDAAALNAYSRLFYYTNNVNMRSLDVILDIAMLFRAIGPPGDEAPRDLLQSLLHAFEVTKISYTDTVANFQSISEAARVSLANGGLIQRRFNKIEEGFKDHEGKDGTAKNKNSCVFDLALAIIWMRTNCSGRLVSFKRLVADLQLPRDAPGRGEENYVAQDEFIGACNHLKVYFEQTGRAVESPSNLLLPEGASSSGPPENTRSNPGNALTNALRSVLPTGRNVLNLNPRSGPPNDVRAPDSMLLPARRAWRGGDDTPRDPGVSGGSGGDPSGVSATAAILASLAVVAASALAGAIKNAS